MVARVLGHGLRKVTLGPAEVATQHVSGCSEHEGGDERIDVDRDITAAFCEERPHEDLLDEVVEEARGKVVADQPGTYDLAPRTSQEG